MTVTDQKNYCEFSDDCPIHQGGQGCVISHQRIWVMNCSEWLTLAEQPRFKALNERKVLIAQDAGGD